MAICTRYSKLGPEADVYEAQHVRELGYSRRQVWQYQGRMKSRLRQFLLEHLGQEHTVTVQAREAGIACTDWNVRKELE